MNSKAVKKLRQIVRKEQVASFKEFADTVDTAPLKLRIKIALRVLRGRL